MFWQSGNSHPSINVSEYVSEQAWDLYASYPITPA